MDAGSREEIDARAGQLLRGQLPPVKEAAKAWVFGSKSFLQ